MRSPYLLRFFSKFHIAFGSIFLVPLLVEWIYERQLGQEMLMAWLMPAAIMGSLGFYLRQKYLKDHALEDLPGLSRREGFLLVGLSWILMIAWGTIPFILTEATPDFASAVFESASGFTTTGATSGDSSDAHTYGAPTASPAPAATVAAGYRGRTVGVRTDGRRDHRDYYHDTGATGADGYDGNLLGETETLEILLRRRPSGGISVEIVV